MKTKLLLWGIAVILSSATVQAQNEPDLNELLNRLDENHMGSVTDVFTSEEMSVLRTHFDALYPPQEIPLQEGGGDEVFAPENVNGNFGHFSSGAPDVFNIIGASGTADFDGAGTFDPNTGLFFLIDNANNVYVVDPVSGLYSNLGTVTPPAGESFTGLEFDPSSGNMYGISTDGAGSSTISIIDPVSLTVTPIGNTGITLAIALAVDAVGALYTFDIDLDQAFRINAATGVATLLGALGFDASFGQGMFLNSATGEIFLTAFNNGAFRSEFRSLNTTTGATTLLGPIGSTSPGGTLQFGWSSLNTVTFGVSDTGLEQVQLFPNPVENQLQLSSTKVIDEAVIYDLQGKELKRISIGVSQDRIDVSHLNSGLYIVSVRVEGSIGSYRFIKN
ncbi:MAG: T9SS type A sorting domain-containing protein [Bacteroidota bacterium]